MRYTVRRNYRQVAGPATVTANLDDWLDVDTSGGAVTVNLPAAIYATYGDGHSVVIQNDPAGGYQQGGTTAGNNITIQPASGETIETSVSYPSNTVTLTAPTASDQTRCDQMVPADPATTGFHWVVTSTI